MLCINVVYILYTYTQLTDIIIIKYNIYNLYKKIYKLLPIFRYKNDKSVSHKHLLS